MSTQTNNTIQISEVMVTPELFPVVKKSIIFKEALEKMEKMRLGIICIVDDENKLLGILTDGDIRRKLLKIQKPFSALFVDDAIDHAIHNPITINPNQRLINAINIMEQNKIWDLPVICNDGKLVGLLHLHPAIQTLLGISK